MLVAHLLQLKIKPLFLLGVLQFFCKCCQAQDFAFSTVLESDSIYRGISLSNEKPAMQFVIDNNFDSGLFVGANVTRHDTAGYFNRKGWQNIYTGYFKKLSPDSALETLISGFYFDAEFPHSWDYLEIKSNYYATQSTRFTFAIADNYYGRKFSSYYAEFSWQPQISDGWYATISLGNTYTPGLIGANSFANYLLGIAHNQNSWQYFVAYTYVDNNIEYIHGKENTGGKFLFNVSYRLF